MSNPPTTKTADLLFSTLHERAKELSCLYKIEEVVSKFDLPLEEHLPEGHRVHPSRLAVPRMLSGPAHLRLGSL